MKPTEQIEFGFGTGLVDCLRNAIEDGELQDLCWRGIEISSYLMNEYSTYFHSLSRKLLLSLETLTKSSIIWKEVSLVLKFVLSILALSKSLANFHSNLSWFGFSIIALPKITKNISQVMKFKCSSTLGEEDKES